MPCTYVVVFWCLLTITTQIVYTNTDSNTKFSVHYSQLQMLITHSKSVFIDGEKVELEKWLSTVNNRDKNSNKNTKTMNTFLKCECADYIKTETKNISELLNNCLTNGAQKECQVSISCLEKIVKDISLTMTTLLAINENYPNLKSQEPYFFKALLMTYLYIKSILDNDQSDKSIKEVPLPESELLKIQRIMLQITNLVHGFTSEHCYSTTDNRIENQVQNQSLKLNEILTAVVTLEPKSQYPPIDMNEFLLKDCVVSPIKMNGEDLQQFCKLFSEEAFVKIPNSKKYEISIRALYDLIPNRYDVKDVYEYLLMIYKVMLTVIYSETDRIIVASETKDLKQLEEIKMKLETKKFPIEMIHHLEYLIKIQDRINYMGININKPPSKLNMIKQSSIDYVKLSSKLIKNNLSFTKIMDILLGNTFQQFWSVFNLLHRESETRSSRVYDLSLHLFPEGVVSISNDENKNKCNALINVYINWLKIESANNESLIDIIENNHLKKKSLTATIQSRFKSNTPEPSVVINDVKEHFQRIRDRNIEFSKILLHQFDDEISAEYLKSDDDLLNIIINAIIYLKNESNTDIDAAKVSVSQLSDLVKLIIDKHEKLNRMGHIIMNFLDNYQIRNCKDINDRDFIYRNKYESNNVKDVEKLIAIHFDQIENNTEFIKTKTHQEINLYDLKRIPRDFYEFPLLTPELRMEEMKLRTNILFDWQGFTREMREIQMEITKNMLNIRDLVQYQRIYLISTFLYLLEKKIAVKRLRDEEMPHILSEIHANDYKIFIRVSEYRGYCQLLYTTNSAVIFAFYKVLNSIHYNGEPILFGVDIVCPRTDTLKLIQVSETKSLKLDDVIQIVEDDEDMFDACSTILSSTLDIKHMISKNVIFFNQSLQNFEYTTPNY